MKVRKITSLFLKLIRKKERVFISEIDDFYLISDGYIIFKIKKEEFELNTSLFIKNDRVKNIFEEALNKNKNEVVLKYFLKRDGVLIAKYSTKDNNPVYINNKYLDFFKECEIYHSEKLDPVLTKIEDEYIGIILPMRIQE